MVLALRQGLAADLPQSHRRSSSAMPPTLRRESADRSNVDVSYTIPLGRVDIPQGIMVATAGDYADNALAGLFLRLRTRICRNPTFVAWQTKEGICPDFLCSGSCEHVAPFRIPQFATARPLRGRFLTGSFFLNTLRSGPWIGPHDKPRHDPARCGLTLPFLPAHKLPAWRAWPAARAPCIVQKSCCRAAFMARGVFSFWTVSHVSPTGTRPVAASPVLRLVLRPRGLRHTPH